MKVVVVSGIWPPDVGGPASHAPALAAALLDTGHAVEVVTTADCRARSEALPGSLDLACTPRLRSGISRVVRAVARAARRSDRVYATSMVRRAALGATLARRPLVVKLVSDEAFERAARSGRFGGTLEEFQATERRRARPLPARHAERRAAPRDAGRRPERVPARPRGGLGCPRRATGGRPEPRAAAARAPRPRRRARRTLGLNGFTLATAGRLTRQKALGDALEAVARLGAVSLVVAGDGPERQSLERQASALGVADRVRFSGPLSRDDVLTLYRAADAALSTSAWENLPHSVVEALAVGTPVVATAVGGVPEVVHDEENGLLVPAGGRRGDRRRDRPARRRRGSSHGARRHRPPARWPSWPRRACSSGSSGSSRRRVGEAPGC